MSGRRILVGVSGGIAAYKALSLIRLLVKQGDDVQVIATESALNFIGRTSFEALSRNPVETELFTGVAEVKHVALGQQADALIVVPATANTVAKFAHGLADDLLTNTFLTMRGPVFLAPAMHTEMWEHPATQRNIALLKERGAFIIGPATGQLTGDDSGAGRLSEPEEIFAFVQSHFEAQQKDLVGKKILISAGGTREALDPVRFLGNRSSGKQGVALAIQAQARGAEVTLVAAHVEIPLPAGIRCLQVQSAHDLQQAMHHESASHDVIIMAAAVADYRPESIAESKIKKNDQGDELVIRLVQNPDVLKGLVAQRRAGQVIIGFAAETAEGDDLLALGQHKLQAKGCDYLVVNQVSWDQGFSKDENSVTILSAPGSTVNTVTGSKSIVANAILDLVSPTA